MLCPLLGDDQKASGKSCFSWVGGLTPDYFWYFLFPATLSKQQSKIYFFSYVIVGNEFNHHDLSSQGKAIQWF